MNCPVCNSVMCHHLFSCGTRPLSVVDLQPTSRESCALKRYPIAIRMCFRCSHVFNSRYTDVDYEHGCTMYNQGSGWKKHVRDTADYVNDIPKTKTIEIGAGDGEFLEMVEGDKFAYEPSSDAKLLEERGIPHLRKYFQTDTPLEDGSLVVMRHVLEHIKKPTEFLSEICLTALIEEVRIGLFVEVPCVENALEEQRLEDWTYEHPNHFTEHSLEECLRLSGFSACQIYKTYGDEVLVAWAEAPLCMAKYGKRTVDSFRKLDYTIKDFRFHDQPYVFWGGAGKSTMFLHALARESDMVVDSDPRKWGKFVPGLPLRIEDPATIKDTDTVVITTNWREQDILDEIRQRGLNPQVYTFKNGKLHACKV